MNIKSGITTGTASKIPFGAGVYFTGVAYSENAAPTQEAIKAGIIGATQDGGSVTITPEFFSPELDGKLVAVKELQTKVGETAVMETSFAELSADLIARSVIGSVKPASNGQYDVVTSHELIADHFYSGFGFYGEHLDGRPIIIIFKNALCTSGLSMESKNKTNTVFKGTFECQSDLEYGTTKLPYAIFIRKESGWTPASPADVES